jgi:hypothetical protein
MQAEPQKEHRWLQKLVGNWTMEGECTMGPDQPVIKNKGTERVRSLGGLWTVGEGVGEMPDGKPADMLMTLGFDPQTKRFRGTWVGSMMTYMWVYDGELDASEKILTLNAEGPSFAGDGKMAKYQDIIEFVDDDHRILRSQSLGDDGKWTQFMTAHYYRTK